MWKDLLLFPVVFICSVIIVSLSVLGLFSIDSFLSFILRSSVCMYIHNTKIFQQKNCKKNGLFQNKFAPCVSVCVYACANGRCCSHPIFFLIFFFPEFRAEETKTTISNKKKILFHRGGKKFGRSFA